MDERDYWASLEYRICREFAGMKDWDLRHLWCDGIIPERYRLGGSEARITGQAWICCGTMQDKWKFTLFLPHPFSSREEIDWESLLPPENVSRWIAVDGVGKHIQIEPSSAVPDL